MSISVNKCSSAAGSAAASDKKNRIVARNRRTAVVYAVISAACLIFTLIYAHFSHGVSSLFMTLMPLVPLVGGAAPFALVAAVGKSVFNRRAFNAYNSGIATLAVGSTLRGICDIAGTSSAYLPAFAVVGAAFILFAVVCRK